MQDLKREEGVVEVYFDDIYEGVDLFNGGYVKAFCKEAEMKVIFEKLVGKLDVEEKVKNRVGRR